MDQTRYETLIQCLNRIDPIILHQSKVNPDRIFSIHFVGADENECSNFSMEAIVSLYSTLFEYLLANGILRVELLFVGPNLISLNNKLSFDFKYEGKLAVVCIAVCDYYHIFLSSPNLRQNIAIPDYSPNIIVMYNPGVWGYPSWLDTFRCIVSKFMASVPILLTSYSLQEAEDDYDILCELFNESKLTSMQFDYQWLWECEINPFCSSPKILKKSVNETEIYRDSQYWSCVLLSK